MHSFSRRSLSWLALCLALAASGCDDDDHHGNAATPTPAATSTAAPATSTPTAVPPTATFTSVPPTSTSTAVPPTATATAVPPTATASPTETPSGIVLPGLEGEVEVILDDHGFPHVYGTNVRSVIQAQGYLCASQRFFEMDMFRRLAEGRLSEVLGLLTFSADVSMRTEFTTRDGRRLEEAIWQYIQDTDPEVAGIIQAYSNGVNGWLEDLRAGRNDAQMPPEYTDGIVLNETPMSLDDWRPQDVIAVARLQAWSLSESLSDEINFARIRDSLPEPLFLDVYRSAPADPAITLPRDESAGRSQRSVVRSASPAPQPGQVERYAELAEFLDRVRAQNPLGKAFDVGSNNWIVAPSMSTNGHAMLANDPHLQLFNPPIWYVNQLVSEDGYSVNGVIFPGLPGVILGHNNYGAFGGTVAMYDVTDVYLEQVTTPEDYPNSPRTVLFKGQQVPVLRIEESFNVRGRATPLKQVIEIVPHHGPMVPDPNPRDGVVGIAATNMSFRWTGHEISNDPRFLIDLTRAQNVEQFRTALSNFAVGAQNWVWADIHGDIAYFPKAYIPQRPAGVIPWYPVDGTGSAEWLADEQGNTLWLPDEKIPQATNPAQGYLATSNNDQIGNTLDNDPLNDDIFLIFTATEGFRQGRILEMLSNATGLEREPGAKISFEDMSRYQYDHKSKEAERLVPLLLAAVENRPDLVTEEMTGALDRLREWGIGKVGSPAYDARSGIDAHDLREDIAPRLTTVSDEENADSIATSIFVGWETRLSRMVFADDFDGTGVGAPGGDDAVKALLHITEDLDSSDAGFVVHTKGENGESTLWDDRTTPDVVETRDEIVLKAFADGLAFLTDKFGSADQNTWQWGRIHQVVFQHFFGQAGIPAYDLGPFAAGGARSTVNPAGFSLNSNSFNFSSGPSKRFVAILDPAGIRAVNVLPGGENGNPGRVEDQPASALYNTINPAVRYGDHIHEWVNGETFDYYIQRSDVEAHAERSFQMRPGE